MASLIAPDWPEAAAFIRTLALIRTALIRWLAPITPRPPAAGFIRSTAFGQPTNALALAYVVSVLSLVTPNPVAPPVSATLAGRYVSDPGRIVTPLIDAYLSSSGR